VQHSGQQASWRSTAARWSGWIRKAPSLCDDKQHKGIGKCMRVVAGAAVSQASCGGHSPLAAGAAGNLSMCKRAIFSCCVKQTAVLRKSTFHCPV
jgi:hypothetical protein